MLGRGQYRCMLCGEPRQAGYARRAHSRFVRDFCKICRPHARRAIAARESANREARRHDEITQEDWL